MLTATFDVRMHEEYGALGLRMQGKPHFDPLAGLAVAHDMLEHFKDDDGTLVGELQALGASIYVRDGESYYQQRNLTRTDPAEHISSEFLSQVWYTKERGEDTVPASPTCRSLAYDESVFARTVGKARHQLYGELDYKDLPAWIRSEQQRRYLVGWMRHGYSRAVRRYRRYSPYHMMTVFTEVENKVDKYLKCADDFGQSVRIGISLHSARCVLTEIQPEY